MPQPAEPVEEINTPLAIARAVRARGWRPFPLDHPKLPLDDLGHCVGLHRPSDPPCNSKRGKHPAVAFGTACTIVPPDLMLQTWFNGSPRNVGIACGPSGLLVIDEDVPDALALLASSLGEELPSTYRVRTRRGWHYYFRAPTHVELGNSAGALAAHDMDVRGGKGHGGYVVSAGSLHESGWIYEVEDWDVDPAPLPQWLIDQILTRSDHAGRTTPGQHRRLRNARPHGDYPPGWDDLPRSGTAAELVAQYERHLTGVQTPGGEFRHELYLAALDGWRLVDCGLRTEEHMRAELNTAIRRVWSAEPDDNDDQHIADGKSKAVASPWRVVEELDGSHNDRDDGQSEDSTESRTRALAAEVYKERLRREARAILAAEALPPLQRLAGPSFLAAPRPEPLIPGLLYRDSLAHIFGADGSGKSLFALDIALSLAAGRQWSADPVERLAAEPRVVHYVMAEGQAVNVERTISWLAFHEIEPTAIAETFIAFPMAVSLTVTGIGRYLTHVQNDRPTLIVLDTKNAMIEGNESDPTDVAEMVRAMHLLRTTCGSCIWLIDHTGVRDRDRARGSGALKAAVDTQHSVRRDDDSGVVTIYRERDKAGVRGPIGEFRLRAVDPSVICTPLTDQDRETPFAPGEGWWRHAPELVPDEVAALDGKGRSAARDVFRLLAYVGERDGLTSAQIRAVLDEGPRKHHRSAYFAGLAQLKDSGVLVTGSTPARLALAARFSPDGN